MNSSFFPAWSWILIILGIGIPLFLIYRRLGPRTGPDPQGLAERAVELDALRNEKFAIERRLATEEQKASLIPALEGEIKACRDLIEAVGREKTGIEKDLASRTTSVEALQETQRALQGSLGKAETDRKELQARIEALMGEKGDLASNLAEAREALGKTSDTLSETRGRLAAEQSRSAEAQTQIGHLQRAKAEVDEVLATRTEKVASLQDAEASLRKGLEKADQERGELQTRIEGLLGEKGDLASNLAELRESLGKTTETLADTKARLADEVAKVAAAQDRIGQIQQEKALVDEALATRTEKVASLQDSEANLRTGLEKAGSERDELQGRIESLLGEKGNLASNLAELRESLGKTTETLTDTKARLADDEAKVAAAQDRIGQIQQEKSLVDEALATRTEKVASLQDSETSLRKSLEKAEGERAELQARIESLLREKGDLASNLAELRESLGKTTENMDELKERLASEVAKAAAAQDQIRQVLREKTTVDEALAARTEKVASLQDSEASLRRGLDKMEGERNAVQAKLDAALEGKAAVEAGQARLTETLEQERRQSEEKLKLLSEAREQMANEFKVLAEEVMFRHGETFSKQNKEQIDAVLTPLRDKMTEFQQGLQVAHDESLKDRTVLAEQIRNLTETSAVMSNETQNLTRALKGEAQVQGAWGEMILGTILEKSGLREGEEYVAQESHTAEDGTRVRPDVIVNLPAGEKIIIDSKVSLKAFEDYVNAGTEADRSSSLQRHLTSMKTHIRALGSKEYHLAAGSRLDYVLMFVPIEGALAAAIQADADLTSLAAECNVAIATPTTLMIALRTVANVWKVERRNKNAEAIADRAGLLYDKFCGFVEDLANIKKHLGKTTDAYDAAMSKLTLGRGNLLAQVGMLRDLGARASKTLRNAQPRDQENEVEAVESAESVGPGVAVEAVAEKVGAEQ